MLCKSETGYMNVSGFLCTHDLARGLTLGSHSGLLSVAAVDSSGREAFPFLDVSASKRVEAVLFFLPLAGGDWLSSSSSSHIVVGSGEHLPITHTGTGSLISGTSPIQLRNILVSPSLIKNLRSIRQIWRDNPVSVEFDLFGFSVKDLRTRAVILRCDSTGDLYSMTAATKHPAPPFAGVVTAARLHQRLGPLGSAQLQLVDSSFSFSKTTPHPCHACRLGKHERLPFSDSVSCTYFPFQLLHLDVWTSPVPSVSGYQFYLVVLDDYTHYVWTFPLKHKYDVLPILRDFYAYARTQIQLPVFSV